MSNPIPVVVGIPLGETMVDSQEQDMAWAIQGMVEALDEATAWPTAGQGGAAPLATPIATAERPAPRSLRVRQTLEERDAAIALALGFLEGDSTADQ